MVKRSQKYANLREFCAANPNLPKVRLARELQVSRFQLYGLLEPDLYPVALTDAIVERLANLLNQKPQAIRQFYEGKAA